MMQKVSGLLVMIFLIVSQVGFSQKVDSINNISHFSGIVSVTNNGFSIIPAFSLNKPAAVFDLSVGKGRLSFEPYFGFSLEGKPWSFLFWWRYKLKEKGKFTINTGAHYGLAFSSVPFLNNGIYTSTITAQRYLAGEFVPNYAISKHVSVGVYYLYSHGLDSYAIQNTHFVTLNSSFTDIKLTKEFFLNFKPQIYYLNLDGTHGFYFTSVLSVARENFPLSVSYQMNKIIKTHITGSPDFTWNVSVVYSFNHLYVKR
jgi:hypothetical protein